MLISKSVLFYSHITHLGEESLSGLVYLVGECQQLWTSVSSRAEKQRKEIFMNVLGGNKERALSFAPVQPKRWLRCCQNHSNKNKSAKKYSKYIKLWNLYLHCRFLQYLNCLSIQQWNQIERKRRLTSGSKILRSHTCLLYSFKRNLKIGQNTKVCNQNHISMWA